MDESVIQLAKQLGFECQTNSHGSWQIFSVHKCENWQLTQSENKWILSIKDVNQVYLNSYEAMKFIKRRYQINYSKGAN